MGREVHEQQSNHLAVGVNQKNGVGAKQDDPHPWTAHARYAPHGLATTP